jgi:hypothetical protein
VSCACPINKKVNKGFSAAAEEVDRTTAFRARNTWEKQDRKFDVNSFESRISYEGRLKCPTREDII